MRADRISLSPEGDAAAVPATVRAVEYLGATVNVAVEAPDTGEVTVTLGDAVYFASPVAVGQSVFLSWKPEDAHALAA